MNGYGYNRRTDMRTREMTIGSRYEEGNAGMGCGRRAGMRDTTAGVLTNMTGMKVRSSESVRSVCVGLGNGRPMRWGDKIFVRVVQGYRVLAEFSSTRLNDMTETLGEIRRLVRGEKGLATVTVRNATEGWSWSRPMKLYGETPRGFGNVMKTEPQNVVKRERMPFPWETH